MLAIILVVAAAVIANILVIHGSSPVPWVGAVAGFLLAIGLPTWMISQKVNWRTDSPSERLCYSVVSAILGLILVGLIINTVLPHLGVSRPLDRGPVLLAVDIWCGIIAVWRPERFNPAITRPRIDRLRGIDWTVGLLAFLCVPLAIMGANRLNNGASGGLTLVMLIIAAITLVLMFIKREVLNDGTLSAAVFFIALSLLLMTSLRGWYITGHDIQQEYKVFELTKDNGSWNISRFQDAYNACLSLTILPTELWQLMRIDDPYIYKFWYQLLFALCPVIVYRISLRFTNRGIAIIAVIYFIAFPTFFTDMPFLNRQEIAYLFVGACMMAATDKTLPRKTARLRMGLFSLGVILSHYSTSYVFLGTLAISWLMYKVLIAARSFMRHWRQNKRWPSIKKAALVPSVSLLNVAVLVVGIGIWNGLATHTVGGFGTILVQAVDSLRGGTDATKSQDVSYSLFGGGAPPESQVLSSYIKTTLALPSSERAAQGFFPVSTVGKYPITNIPLPNLPITSAGQVVDDSGLSVASLNSIMRSGAARLLQLFVVLGLYSALRTRKRKTGWITELIALASGALVIVALQVVVPAISVDYGVLRAFQQALIVFGPLVAVGSVTIFWFLREKWSLRAAFAVAILFFASLVGTIPQITGGYPAQLNLNNSGQYYDLYYTHPQSITAIEWLQSNIPGGAGTTSQAQVQIDPYAYGELQTFTHLNLDNTNFPTLLQKSSYVFLGFETATGGRATVLTSGDLITYQYPMKLLNSSYNLVYSSNGAAIYG
jgi:uncharacterized membrane protein